MKKLLNAMRMQAMQAMGEVAQVRIGLIDSYDANNYCAKVKIQPENVLTGWLPVTSQWVGNGWGMFAPPSIGDLVEVHFQEGSFEAGIINMRFFNDVARPLNVPSGEFWLQHKSGAYFKLLNNGNATFSDGHGASVALNGDGTINSQATQWNHAGNVTVTGNIIATADISDRNGTKGTVQHIRDNYDLHTHPGVTTGGGSTGTTSSPL